VAPQDAALPRPLEIEELPCRHGEAVKPDVAALTYIKVGLGPEAFNLVPYRVRDGETLQEAAEEMALRVNRHVGALLLSDRLPMASHVLPEVNQRFRGDYDHLARVDEWTINEGDESE
jgi:ATP-dependent helicase/nuclease subunit B